MRGFGDLEAAIMSMVWAWPGRVLVRDVHRALNQERRLAVTTVQTVMESLHHKGWLAREGRPRQLVWATVSREDHAAGLISQILADVPDPAGMITRLLERIDPAQASRLRTVLLQRVPQQRRAAQPARTHTGRT